MMGLIIKEQWLNEILAGRKTWELRGRNTKIRGKIALIQKGSGQVVGTCQLVDVKGPLTPDEYRHNFDKHRVPVENGLMYPKTYAWILQDARRFEHPISYKHPSGAVIWVRLPDLP